MAELKTPLAMIAACDLGGGIGFQNQLLWSIPEDMRYFRQVTQGKPVIMGRKTFESIGRALPERLNLVVSRRSQPPVPGIVWCRSYSEALQKADQYAQQQDCSEVVCIGGGELYRIFLPYAVRFYLSVVNVRIPIDQVDTTIPHLKSPWQRVSCRRHYSPSGYLNVFRQNYPLQFWIETHVRHRPETTYYPDPG